MTYDSIERSVQDGVVAELYDFVGPAQTFRLTSYRSDVSFGGNLYTATLEARSDVMLVDMGSDQTDVTIQIPATHPLAVYYAVGIPPRELLVTITRYHVPWAVSSQYWQGYVSGLSFAGDTAAFRVPSGINDALATDVPSATAQRICNHVLYDAQCTMVPAIFAVGATVVSISSDARTITVAGSFPSADYSVFGFLQSTSVPGPTTERRTITGQAPSGGNVALTIQAPFPVGSLTVGQSVVAFAGCDHTVGTCQSKFINALNFGGHPYMPPSNLFYVGLVLNRNR